MMSENMSYLNGQYLSWFDRLNDFEKQETLRQINFKQKHWPNSANGVWSKDKSRAYPHILEDGDKRRVFYPPIADKVIEYCMSRDIALHTELLNLRSSQAYCFNVMFLLREHMQNAVHVLASILPGVRQVTEIEFEYTGDNSGDKPENTSAAWLGEYGGKRGQNRTSIDCYIKWTDGIKNYITLIEWKYTEKGFGKCGGHASNGNKNKQFCCDNPASSYGAQADKCYLVHRKHRLYWDRLAEAGICIDKLSGIQGCPFIGPFYQLLRQYLMAAYLKEKEHVDEAFVVVVTFKGNTSLLKVPEQFKSMGSNIVDVWNKLLSGVPPMAIGYAENIAEAMRNSNIAELQALAEYLQERYGI